MRAVEPLQHRFAYIGSRPAGPLRRRPGQHRHVTALQDTYFQGGTAAAVDARAGCAARLGAGQRRNRQRLPTRFPATPSTCACQDAPHPPAHHRADSATSGSSPSSRPRPRTASSSPTPATSPNATGSDAVGAFLVDTGGRDTTAVADRIRTAVGTTATVTDIAATRGTVGSSLTAVNLAGLTRIELGFGLVLAAASGGLVLALGLAERRRSFVIAHALGATRRHLRSFVLAETAILVACGLAAGAILGAALSQMLVRVLTGIFDPPPTALSTPWTYLAAIAAVLIVAISAVSGVTVRLARRSPLTVLGEL